MQLGEGHRTGVGDFGLGSRAAKWLCHVGKSLGVSWLRGSCQHRPNGIV